MLALKGLTKTYIDGQNTVTALQDVMLEVAQGEFVILTGRSGSGKTTLLNLAAGLTRPTTGEVLFQGVNLWRLSDREQSHLRNRKFGFIFQFPSLLPALTVHENVMLPVAFGEGNGTEGTSAQALELLEAVGLTEKRNAYPRQLSAGQQQRVVIARALVNHPELLLADEPTSNLDEQTEHEIMDLFRRIHETTGVTILLVTHTKELARYGTRSLEMAGGRIRADRAMLY